MRNMSFFKTIEQIRKGTKTVTRRLGWTFLKPGHQVMAVVKCQGLRKGDKIEKIRPLLITKVSREYLNNITDEEVRKEGFGNIVDTGYLSGRSYFIRMFSLMNKCKRDEIVTRIEFEYIQEPK